MRLDERLEIGVDLDGVCYDFGLSFRQWEAQRRSVPVSELPVPSEWEFYRQWDMTLAEFMDSWHEGIKSGMLYRHGDPIDGSLDGLAEMIDDGHRVHVITSRLMPGLENLIVEHTRGWLEEHRVPHHGFTVIGSGDSKASSPCPPVNVMIDDLPDNAAPFEGTSTRFMLVSRSWNAHVDGFERVSCLRDAARRLKAANRS